MLAWSLFLYLISWWGFFDTFVSGVGVVYLPIRFEIVIARFQVTFSFFDFIILPPD